MRNWFNRWRPIWLACFVAGYVLTVLVCLASGSDYTVTRGTEIGSERPIGLLIIEAGLGVLNGDGNFKASLRRVGGSSTPSTIETTLYVDGREQPGRTSVLAAWRLIGFVVWDADGSVERCTTAIVRGRPVRIRDAVSNGRVAVEVVVGPPLGDPRVRYAVLELEANEDVTLGKFGPVLSTVGRGSKSSNIGAHLWATTTRIELSCSAVIDLPGDRCRLVSRIARRIAEREAGPELTSRVRGLAAAGRAAVLSGRGRLTDSVVAEFLERVCK